MAGVRIISDVNTLECVPFVNSYARLREPLHVSLQPTPLKDAHLISFNADAAGLLDLDPRRESTLNWSPI